MAVKAETRMGAGFDLQTISRQWLTKYLNSPDKEFRGEALDLAIDKIIIESMWANLPYMYSSSDTDRISLRNLEEEHDKKIKNLRKSYGEKSHFFRLYKASICRLENWASKLEKEKGVSRGEAFGNVGVIFRQQKEKVLADLRESAIDPNLG